MTADEEEFERMVARMRQWKPHCAGNDSEHNQIMRMAAARAVDDTNLAIVDGLRVLFLHHPMRYAIRPVMAMILQSLDSTVDAP